jgi:hypothetical protein
MTRTKLAPRINSSAAPSPAIALARNLMPPPQPLAPRAFVGRSLFPLLTLTWIAGTFLWGPWITLALAVTTWSLVGRFG